MAAREPTPGEAGTRKVECLLPMRRQGAKAGIWGGSRGPERDAACGQLTLATLVVGEARGLSEYLHTLQSLLLSLRRQPIFSSPRSSFPSRCESWELRARTRVRSPPSLRPERVRPAGPPLGAHSHAHPRTRTRTRGSTRTGSQSHTKGSSDGGRNMLRWHCNPPSAIQPCNSFAVRPQPPPPPEPPVHEKVPSPQNTHAHITQSRRMDRQRYFWQMLTSEGVLFRSSK
ncbi:uncharacterized protein LOC114631911 [Grammomys surdaster]|uniref:uncharacterized protein LOC114631911 n=1 Tax=Grammomys surdaster TaxID=491861 RepID=UPI00109F476E|nr:uncharacterized protein LOC114631911 [Grammomys surdaster]